MWVCLSHYYFSNLTRTQTPQHKHTYTHILPTEPAMCPLRLTRHLAPSISHGRGGGHAQGGGGRVAGALAMCFVPPTG